LQIGNRNRKIELKWTRKLSFEWSCLYSFAVNAFTQKYHSFLLIFFVSHTPYFDAGDAQQNNIISFVNITLWFFNSSIK